MIKTLVHLREFLRQADINPVCVRVVIEVDCGVAGVFRHAVAREWVKSRGEPPDAAPIMMPNEGNVMGVKYEIVEKY